MSKALISKLPLPEPYRVVSREESVLKTWLAVNDWYNFVVGEGDNGGRLDRLKVMAPHIKLGLKHLSVRMVKAYTEAGSPDQTEDPDLVGAFYSVQIACQEVQKNDLYMHATGSTISSFTVALDAAHAMFGRLFPNDSQYPNWPREQSTGLNEMRVCDQFYQNLDRYNRYARAQGLSEQTRIEPRTLRARMQRLEAGIAHLEAHPDKGRKLDDDEAELPSKKARKAQIQPKKPGMAKQQVRPDKGQKQGKEAHKQPQGMSHAHDTVQPEQLGQSKDEIMSTLIFDASESRILAFQDTKARSRDAGLTTLKDFAELVSGDWLSDTVIDPHLAFFCSLKNGQPDNGPASKSAPEWQAWPSYLYLRTSVGSEWPGVWPPRGYPQAQFGETHHHLFPIHLDGNHWGLAHLSWGGAEWSLDWFSGLSGYLEKFRVQWAEIERYLKRAWGFRCDQILTINEPEQQRQGNASDCGVFVLCEARCLIMGWPVDTFGQEDMKFMRRRICFELELDRTSAS